MLFLIITAILLTSSSCFSTAAELDSDANIYRYVISSLKQLEVQKAEEYGPNTIQRASSVCYDELGCFDKEGTFKHLKQLPEPPETVNTQFLLYTRKNPAKPQFLDYKKPETILKSNLNSKLPLKIMTHGFGGRNNLTWAWNMKNAFLKMHDVNVIVVDWSLGARVPYYIQAAVNSELVGAEVAVLFYFMKDNLGFNEENFHCIGFSLGAQVMGFVGKRMMMMRETRPSRISGLDPASPLFEEYGGEVHLFKNDADFVDVVHTNADLLIYGGVGMGMAVGHVDFYPNGGKRQPGCKSTISGALKDLFKNDRDHACNHERAVHLFIDSILHPDLCRYVSYRCSNYSEFLGAQCMSCGEDNSQCGHMGYHVEGTGTYYLMTKSKPPFCSELVKMSIEFSNVVRKTYGAIIIKLIGAKGDEHNVTISESDEKLIAGEQRKVVFTLDKSLKPLKRVDALYLRYNGWFTKGQPTFGISSLTVQDAKDNYIFKSCDANFILKDKEYQKLSSCV